MKRGAYFKAGGAYFKAIGFAYGLSTDIPITI